MKKETVADKLRTEMAKATRWMAVSDLVILIQCSTSAIRRNLRKEDYYPLRIASPGIYKSQKIPGDQHGRNQWAMHATDTTGWDNAAPIKSLPKPKKSKKQRTTTPAGSPVRVSQQATYGGLILMCAPANKPSLIKAVGDLLVNEFVTSGKKFSAFDITKRLRDIVLVEAKDHEAQMAKLPPGTRQTFAILLEPQEQGTVFVQGLKVCKVEHDDVKAIVHDIFNAGGMPNLGRVHTSGGFWEYDTQANIDAAVAAQAPAPLPVATVVSGATGSTTDPDPISGGTMGSTYDGSSTI